jgi:uncharacterized protein (DUF934 family)
MVAPYKITAYTRKRAKTLGVEVAPSKNPAKKLDVFKQGSLVASVGARGMADYPTHAARRGWAFARTRRRLYRQRHEKDRHIRNTPGWYADKLLW